MSESAVRFSESDLLELAGKGAFGRGEQYFRNGRVALKDHGDWGFQAQARGTQQYHLELRITDGAVNWQCSCPAADDGSFCKHLVAGVLTWQEMDESGGGAPGEGDDRLLKALKKLRKDRLVALLYRAAERDMDLWQSLEAQLLPRTETDLRKVLSGMFNTGGFLDYRDSMDYASRLETPLALLSDLLEQDPVQCHALSEYSCRRLLKVIERVDDSAGCIGEVMERFAVLYARSVKKADVNGKKLADEIYRLKTREDWHLFPLAEFWTHMNATARERYAGLVTKDFDAAMAKRPDRRDAVSPDFGSGFYSEFFRREELARVQGDVETLLEMHQQDMDTGYAYRKLVEVCREFGRDAEAMNWAERGLRAHPDFPGMRELAAEEYQRAGLDEEALEQLWQAFLRHPGSTSWERLKSTAGGQWPEVRERALAAIESRERAGSDGVRDVSVRVRLLLADGDPETAADLAGCHTLSAGQAYELGKALSEADPRRAAGFMRPFVEEELIHANTKIYPRAVRRMKQIRELDPSSSTTEWLQDLRERYQRRPSLIKRMDKAKL